MISISKFSSRNICYGKMFMNGKLLLKPIHQPNLVNCIISKRSLSLNKTISRANFVFRVAVVTGAVVITMLMKKRKDASLKDKLADLYNVHVPSELFRSDITLYRYKNYTFSSRLLLFDDFKSLENFEFRKSDIIVSSFPKAGTTWVQEIVYMLCNDCKPTGKTSDVLETRFPYLEYPYPGIKSLEKSTGKRLIKTHLPFSLLPESFLKSKPKLIYVVRNPRDIVVSYYYFMKLLIESSFIGSFAEFVDLFTSDKVPYSPLGNHIRSYFDNKNCSNILFVSYEDLKKDPNSVIKDIAEFLQINVDSNEVTEVAAATGFISMQTNPSVNYQHWKEFGFAHKDGQFLRKGEIGDWKNYFDDKLLSKFEDWEKEQNFPIQFEYQP